jgi:hypothetical protein
MQGEGAGAAQEPAEWLGLAANVVGALSAPSRGG